MRTPGGEVIRGRWGRSLFDSGLSEAFPADCVAVLLCCTVLGLVSCRMTAGYTGDCRPASGSRQVIPYAVLVGGSEGYGYQSLACEVMLPVLSYPASGAVDAHP
jgi:hypothetical protein